MPASVWWQSYAGRNIPFSIPFKLRAHGSHIWIAPASRESGRWDKLHLRGTNWAGFQSQGCVNELWKHSLEQYIAFLVHGGFNAVRLPLSAPIIMAPSFTFWANFPCGARYKGRESLAVLDDVLQHLLAAGMFVMLDIHTVTYPEKNTGLWCATGLKADGTGCTPESETILFSAWRKLAQKYCSFPNVIMAGEQ